MTGNCSAEVLEITGPADIQTISDLHTRVCDALMSSGTEMVLDIQSVSDFDLTFIQLIEAARRQAERNGKLLRLNNPPSDTICDALNRGGFLTRPQDRAFWRQRAE